MELRHRREPRLCPPSINRVFFNALSHSHAQPAAASEADRESVFAELKEQPVVHPSIITVVATINQVGRGKKGQVSAHVH